MKTKDKINRKLFDINLKDEKIKYLIDRYELHPEDFVVAYSMGAYCMVCLHRESLYQETSCILRCKTLLHPKSNRKFACEN